MKAVRSVAVLALIVVLPACGGGRSDNPSTGKTTGLTGVFSIEAGSCQGEPTGSYFRMVQPGGTVEEGPFVTNGDSTCGDQTVTPLVPGTDGGLRLGAYQPHPDPAFDPGGNAVNGALAQPAKWFAVDFALGTNPVDPQTSAEAPPPSIQVAEGKLTGDLRSLSAAWNGQHFNQGSPKPDGSSSGNTASVTGTLAGDGSYVLEWASQIEGGPFDNFTGVWHLEGQHRPD